MSLRAFLCSMLFISACAKAGEPEAETDWASAARKRMVDKIADYSPRYRVEDPRVLDAMRRVPRHEFVPKEIADYAYADRPLPIGEKQTISQPFIVGYMTAALNLKPQHKVLEIGTGSGYQAAILGELAGAVYSIEIVESLGREAARRLKRLGYKNVHVKLGDGYQGWPEYAPFDAVIVTCAPDHIPQPLVDQLKVGGLMMIPVGGDLIFVRRTPEGMAREKKMDVRFVPMTGEARSQRGGINE